MGNWLLTDVYENIHRKILEDLANKDEQVVKKILEYIDAYTLYLQENFSQQGKFPRDGLSIS